MQHGRGHVRNKRRLIEALIILLFVVLGAFLLSLGDVYEWFYHFSRTHEEYELDEWMLILPLLCLGLLVYIFLRIREANKEIERRRLAEEKALAAYREAEEMRNLKAEFSAIFSHELRTPLNGMLGILDLLEHEHLSPQMKEMVELASRNGRNLKQMLDDVLEFTQLTKSRVLQVQAPFSPSQAIHSVYELFVPVAGSKGLAFPEPEIERVPEVLTGSEGPMRQILSCLLSNAIKFTDTGSVRIQAEVDDEDSDRQMLVFRVVDTGPGIANEDQARIFEPYTQLDYARTRKKGGIGLGLSFARRLITLLGGSIAITSEQGQGTTFEVRLPVVSM